MSLQAFKDATSRGIYGMTATEAHNKGICIDCKQQIVQGTNIFTPADQREYQISGVCAVCWDKIFAGPEDAGEDEAPR